MDDKETLRIDPGSSEYTPTEKVGLLQIIRGEDIGHEFEITPGNNQIGRQKGCQIQVINKSISRRHAQIICNPEAAPDRRYVMYDLRSTNGTKVNNEPIQKRVLRDGDRVQFGTVVCKFMEVDSLERSFLKAIKNLIEYDHRTNLLQIKPFYQRLQNALEEAEGQNQPLTVLMMDLDGLKKINEAHGHLAGTHVIETIAKAITEELPPSAVAAIYGGDEFAAFLPDTTKEEAVQRAEHLREIISNLVFSEKNIEESITISIGVAEYPSDAFEMMVLVGNADKALSVAKNEGKNCVIAYEPEPKDTE